jgi:predicted methyltransferase
MTVRPAPMHTSILARPDSTRVWSVRLLAALLQVATLATLGCGHQAASTPATATAETAKAAEVAPAQATRDYKDVVQASDRDAADRALDEGRKPEALLSFMGVAPGMKVAEIGAGGGYTSELLARTVGPTGKVYMQNSPFLLARFAEKPLSERLQKPIMSNAQRLDREFDDPFPAELRDLDIVSDILFYHDTVWMKTDRARMNKAIYDALKPGGLYIIVDHSSAEGKGVSETESLHRIEESVVRSEVEAAGFRLVESADFLRSPEDTRDWSASPRVAGEKRGTSDRFVLKFQKP